MYLISLYWIYLQFQPSFGLHLSTPTHTVINDIRNTGLLVERIFFCVSTHHFFSLIFSVNYHHCRCCPLYCIILLHKLCPWLLFTAIMDDTLYRVTIKIKGSGNIISYMYILIHVVHTSLRKQTQRILLGFKIWISSVQVLTQSHL